MKYKKEQRTGTESAEKDEKIQKTKKNTNVHMLRCLECAILHLRDFVPHTDTRTHSSTETLTHTHMQSVENPFEISQRAKAFIQLESRQQTSKGRKRGFLGTEVGALFRGF